MESYRQPPEGSRKEKYAFLFPQMEALLEDVPDTVGAMAQVCACLKTFLHFHWVGFYLVSGNELRIGPYQGPPACSRIGYGKGVCGTAWKEKRTLVVPDVHQFPGHIACSPFSKSEIVIPLLNENHEVWAVLDIDSDQIDDFGADDVYYLEQIAKKINPPF